METATNDLEQAIHWAYRLFLGRHPDNVDVVHEHVRTLESPTVEAVSTRFRNSPEFTARLPQPANPKSTDFAEFRDPGPYSRENGSFRDVFGVKTRVSYLPGIYERFSGGMSGDDGVELLPMHDDVELTGMLDAGRAATTSLTVMELGAGWGPWVSMGAKMAQRRNLSFRLIAVEGSSDHFDFLQTHLADNGIDLARCKLVHGIVGTKDGIANFPKLLDPSADYALARRVPRLLPASSRN